MGGYGPVDHGDRDVHRRQFACKWPKKDEKRQTGQNTEEIMLQIKQNSMRNGIWSWELYVDLDKVHVYLAKVCLLSLEIGFLFCT